jgi:hypothetical protein
MAPRRRARLTLIAPGVTTVLLLATAVGLLLLAGIPGLHRGPAPTPAPAPAPSEQGAAWDLPGEAALAARPMPVLPVQAAAPQPLAAHPAPVVLHLPAATGELAGVPAGFPDTPAGAVAALTALTTRGLRGGDPQIYASAYQAVAAPGAPPAASTRLVDLLTSLRASAGLAPSGPSPDLTMTWQPMQVQIKGVLDGGRYAVVCVLGQFTGSFQGRVVTTGVGDCQAMRWMRTSGGSEQWLISPGPAAAKAPDAWPGSQDALNSGYQEVQ